MAVNFVKFERGSAAIYERRKNNHSLDKNTLYFIYDPTKPEDGGLLYLGYTLIGGSASSLNNINLSDLNDVDTTGVSDGALLWYNNTTSQWEPATAAQIANSSIGQAVQTSVSILTKQEGQTDVQALATVQNPKEGDIAIVNGESYVYNGSNWSSLTSSSLEDRVSTLETSIQNIEGTIDSKIAAANHLVYSVENSLNGITTPEDNTIYLVPSSNPGATDSYDEYMYVNGSFERLGAINEVNLAGYATETYVNNAVSNLASTSYVDSAIQNLASTSYVDNAIQDLSNTYVSQTVYNAEVGDISEFRAVAEDNDITLSEGLKTLYERLQWSDITDE